MLTLDEALQRFQHDGMAARNYSEKTRESYLSDLRLVLAFLTERGLEQIAEMGLAHLEAYQAEMDRWGYAPSSRQRKTHAIKSLFRFLARQGLITHDPAAELIPPPVPERDRRFLTKEEYQGLTRAVSHKPRDAAIIELFLQTGLRLSEMARLTLNDVTLPERITSDPKNTGECRVKRKGGRWETVPLNHKACRALAVYLKERPSVPHSGLFITKFGEQMGPRGIQQLIAKYHEEAGIERAAVHTLRHTFATQQLRNGASLPLLKDMLGHHSIKTTAIYTSVTKDEQREFLQANPL